MKTLKGKKCMITGASSGLGLELTRLFIQEEAEVIMLCRNESKSKAVIEKLLTDHPEAKIQLEIADLSSLDSLNNFIEQFKKKYTSIDMLINNAAVLKNSLTTTIDDFESMFQVNYLAPFILTRSLIDLLKAGDDPKILNIALPAPKYQIDFNDLQSLKHFKPMENLLKSKNCLVIYSLELASRIRTSGIKVLTGIPNHRPFRSNLGREMPLLMGWAWNLISVKTEKIAGNIPFVLSQEDMETGSLFKGRKAFPVSQYWQDTDVREQLWKDTERLLITTNNHTNKREYRDLWFAQSMQELERIPFAS